MKFWTRLVLLALITLVSLPEPLVAATAPRARKTQRSSTSRAKSNKHTNSKQRSRTSSQRQKATPQTKGRGSKAKSRSGSQRKRAYTALRIDNAERRAELRRLDSLRLRNGGTDPIPRIGEQVETIAQIEPVLIRFRKADSTLSMRTIESLYFARQVAPDDSLFFRQIIPKVDTAIAKEQYATALSLARKGLHRNPMHIGLLKRACELAHHEQDSELDNYIWQITQLLELIQKTGDGKSIDTAWQVMERNDAILYETLWLGVETQHILQRRSSKHQGRDLLVLTVQDPKGKKQEHYYLVGRK